MSEPAMDRLSAKLFKYVVQRTRAPDMESLCTINSDGTKDVERFFILDEFGDRLLAQASGKVNHCRHQMLVHRIVTEVANETAIDLQIIDVKVFQLIERRESHAEIVQRELVALRS